MASYLAETVETSYVQGELARYGYREYGAEGGIPLVLLMRYKGTLDDWDPELLDLLAKERRIITVDNVGVGYTDGTAPDTIAAMADGVVDFLKAKGLKKVHLAGWSMGGFIAQVLAVTRPELFETITIAGSGPGEPSVRPAETPRSLEIRTRMTPCSRTSSTCSSRTPTRAAPPEEPCSPAATTAPTASPPSSRRSPG